MRRTPFLLTPRRRAPESGSTNPGQEAAAIKTVASVPGDADRGLDTTGQGGISATQSDVTGQENAIPSPPGGIAEQNGTIPSSQDGIAGQNGTFPSSQGGLAGQNGTSDTRSPGDSTGQLRISVLGSAGNRPIANASIAISYSGEPDSVIQTITTDGTGLTPTINLPTPPLAYSLEPLANQPYSEYTFYITADGYEPILINGAELLPDVTAIQNVLLDPIAASEPNSAEVFVIGPHTLYGEYPPKIIEPEIQPTFETGEIVLSRVVIPEFVVVHDGPPSDASAPNYYVPYRDYIKNVASSEIYATWPEAALYANILAIQSFTLNRVYTEFYRNKGYNFTITSSTAYDHKWINERNIYDTISAAVDSIFNNYLSRPNVRQPILTQYCDGKRVTCPNVMSQWGSKSLADQGYSAIQILRYYYGPSIYINTSEEISGIPSSYPGEPLTIGSRGSKVRQMQEQLNAIADVYYSIPNIAADGIFGERTREAVIAFQKQFDLPPSGIVDFPTWYKISQIYVAVTRIAEYS